MWVQCQDAAWPENEGGDCKSGMQCYKVSQFYWQCDVKQPPTGDFPAIQNSMIRTIIYSITIISCMKRSHSVIVVIKLSAQALIYCHFSES